MHYLLWVKFLDDYFYVEQYNPLQNVVIVVLEHYKITSIWSEESNVLLSVQWMTEGKGKLTVLVHRTRCSGVCWTDREWREGELGRRRRESKGCPLRGVGFVEERYPRKRKWRKRSVRRSIDVPNKEVNYVRDKFK